MATLPLFPLGTALMPGALLPLQIFEPRYVTLLQNLISTQEEQPPVFGVVAIRKGFEVGEHGARALHPIGCSAQIRQATSLGEGRFLIIAEGRTRFELGEIENDSTTPYAVAHVNWLLDEDGDANEVGTLAAMLRRDLAAYRESLGEDEMEAPDEDRELSYWLPQALDLDLSDRQQMLASSSTETRLRLCRQIVRRERTLTSSLGTIGHSLGGLGGPISPN